MPWYSHICSLYGYYTSIMHQASALDTSQIDALSFRRYAKVSKCKLAKRRTIMDLIRGRSSRIADPPPPWHGTLPEVVAKCIHPVWWPQLHPAKVGISPCWVHLEEVDWNVVIAIINIEVYYYAPVNRGISYTGQSSKLFPSCTIISIGRNIGPLDCNGIIFAKFFLVSFTEQGLRNA